VAVEKMGSKVESKRIGGQDALRREADAARRDGFSAKAAIHPSQMEVINRCFSELSDAADVDKAAASRSLAVLADRGLISIEQTRSRGRAAIAKLTREGRDFATRMAEASRKGEARLFKDFSTTDKQQLSQLLNQIRMPWIMPIGSTNGSSSGTITH
jgi:DNA-binding MarR family transcriptional regulator